MAQQDERRSTLGHLLARNRREFHIEYGGYLCNHMSQYLVALYELGAPKERLEKAYEDYSTESKLEPAIPPSTTITRDTWLGLRGKKSHYLDLVAFFDQEIEHHGVRQTLRYYVPQLLEGVCGAAFHGVIQLGYALEVMDIPNIAEGLAYWTYAFYSLGKPKAGDEASMRETPPRALQTGDVTALLDRVRCDARFDSAFTGENKTLGFQKRLHLLAAQHRDSIEPYDIDFGPFVLSSDDARTLSTPRGRLESLVDLFTLSALKVFASSGYGYFFVLHLVTAFRALRVTLDVICKGAGEEDEREGDVREEDAEVAVAALNYFWRAVVCSYVAVNRPAVSDISPQEIKRDEGEATKDGTTTMGSWEGVIAAVMPSHDEHLVKLVFVCWKEAREREEKEEKAGTEWGEHFLHSAINTTLRFRRVPHWVL